MDDEYAEEAVLPAARLLYGEGRDVLAWRDFVGAWNTDEDKHQNTECSFVGTRLTDRMTNTILTSG